MISYERLWKTMRDCGISQYDLYTRYNVTRSLLDRFRKNMNVELLTIDRMCGILHCRIEDIVEYIPDEPTESEPDDKSQKEEKLLCKEQL